MMKRTIAFLLLLVLILALAVPASAAGAPKLTKQPETGTTDEKGTVTFSIKASNFKGLTWKFVNPETGEEYTGKTVSSAFRGLKVDGANKQKITLRNVPDEMHGWTVYAHLTGNGYEVDSDHVLLLVYGMADSAAAATETDAAPADETEVVPVDPAAPAEQPAAPAEQPAAPAPVEQPAAVQDDGKVTVRGENVTVFPVDEYGTILDDQGAAELTFDSPATLAVRASGTVLSWTVNGMSVELSGAVDGFILRNVTSDLVISAVVSGVQVAAADSGDGVLVTCVGCSFSVSGNEDDSLTSGRVPAGTSITVIADSKNAASGGYSINGGEYERQGKLSFRIVVTEDTTIRTQAQAR